jgi:hypothetical protein
MYIEQFNLNKSEKKINIFKVTEADKKKNL